MKSVWAAKVGQFRKCRPPGVYPAFLAGAPWRLDLLLLLFFHQGKKRPPTGGWEVCRVRVGGFVETYAFVPLHLSKQQPQPRSVEGVSLRNFHRRPSVGENYSRKYAQLRSVGGISSKKHAQPRPVGGISSKKHAQPRSVGGISSRKHAQPRSVGGISSRKHAQPRFGWRNFLEETRPTGSG